MADLLSSIPYSPVDLLCNNLSPAGALSQWISDDWAWLSTHRLLSVKTGKGPSDRTYMHRCCFLVLFSFICLHLSGCPLLLPPSLTHCLRPSIFPVSISVTGFISPPYSVCSLCLSLREYIHDADKCNGPLAVSPQQLRLGRLFSYIYTHRAFFYRLSPSCSWALVGDANSQRSCHLPVGLREHEWQLWSP